MKNIKKRMKNMSIIKKRIKHNDLTHYFMTPHEQLPASYLASCEKFFKSFKRQAPSFKRHEKNTIKMYKQLRKE